MKHCTSTPFAIVFTVALTCVSFSITSRLTAQVPGSSQPLITHVDPPKIPENLFPFGGFNVSSLNGIRLNPEYSGPDNALYGYNKYQWQAYAFQRMLSRAGLNAIYHVNSFGFTYDAICSNNNSYNTCQLDGEQSMALAMPSGTVTYEGGTDFDISKFFVLHENYYFLASSESDPDFNYQAYNATSPKGGIGQNPLYPKEWYVPSNGTASGDNVFTVQQGQYINYFVDASDMTTSGSPSNAEVDFIYRLDGSEQESGGMHVQNDPNTLFTVSAEVIDGGKSKTSITPINITWSSFNSTSNLSSEPKSITTFANQAYKVLRMALPLPAVKDLGGLTNPQFNFTLTTSGRCGIYIRGFRLRTKREDNMLQGLHDNDINSDTWNLYLPLAPTGQQTITAHGMRSMLNTYKATNTLPKITAITTGGEFDPSAYRSIAYLDNLLFKMSGQHIYEFLTFGDYAKYRAIYQDQNNTPPPVIMEENFGMTTYLDAPHPYVSRDAIPYAFQNPSNAPSGFRYDDMGFPLAHDWSSLTNTSDGAPGYVDYTKDIQGDYAVVFTDGTSTNSNPTGKYDNAGSDYKIAAKGAYLYGGQNSPQSKWYALINAITTLNDFSNCGGCAPAYSPSTVDNTNPVDAVQLLHARNDFMSALRNGPVYLRTYLEHGGGTYTDFLTRDKGIKISNVEQVSTTPQNFHDLAANPGKFGHSNKPSIAGFNSSSFYSLDQRCINSSEIRADVWQAIAYGAKGIYFNPIGSEAHANIGFCDWEFGKYDPTKDTLGANYNQQDASTGPFTLYDGPTYATTLSSENLGLLKFTAGDPCSEAGSFLGSTPSNSVPWDAKVIQYSGSNTSIFNPNNSSTPSTGQFYYRQLIPMAFDNGVTTDPAQITLDFMSSSATKTLIVYGASGWTTTTSGPLPDASNWFALVEGGSHNPPGTFAKCDADSKLNWYVWNTTWNSAVAAQLLLPSNDNFNSFKFDNLVGGDVGTDYRFGSVTVIPKISTYYGFHDKWMGVTTSIKDLSGIAPVLASLNWKETINLAATQAPGTSSATDYTNTSTNSGSTWGNFPIQEFRETVNNVLENHTSQKIRRYTWPYIARTSANETGYTQKNATIDAYAYDNPDDNPAHRVTAADAPLFMVGRFVDPIDANAQYIVVANRRTWPVRRTYASDGITPTGILSSDGSNALLGAVDVRQFNFQLRWSKLNPSFAFYSVTNMRTGVETIIPTNTTAPFSVILDPGEGTLFRIRPAYAMIAGRVSDVGMAYNNGHRIAKLHDDPNGNPQSIMVWQKQGKIEFNIDNNPALTGVDNFVTASGESTLFDPSGTAQEVNPSVAAKASLDGSQDTIAVIWNESNGTNARVIHFAWCVSPVATTRNALSWNFGSFPTLPTIPWLGSRAAWDATIEPNHLVTPSITPSLDGFFVSWANYNSTTSKPFIQPAFLGIWGTVTKTATIKLLAPVLAEASTAQMCVFPTVASRDESSLSVGGPAFERLHLAWEEDLSDGTSQIYYKRYDHTLGTGSSDIIDETFTIERVSKMLQTCKHHHPNIAVLDQYILDHSGNSTLLTYGEPLVTWESILTSECTDQGLNLILKPGTVEVVTRERYLGVNLWSSFTAFYPEVGNLPLPLIETTGNHLECCIDCIIGNPSPTMRSDLILFQDLPASQIHARELSQGPCGSSGWRGFRILDNGLYPNLTEPFVQSLSFLSGGPFTYRGTMLGEDGLFNAAITSLNFPIEVSELPSLVTSLTATVLQACEEHLRYSVAPGSIGLPTAAEPWSPSADSTSRREIKWMLKDLTRDGFGTPYSPSDSNHASHSNTSYGWPITEDSIRTYNFTANSGDEIHLPTEVLLKDSTAFQMLLSDSTHFVSFKLVLKDSATRTTRQVIDEFTLTGGPNLMTTIRSLGQCMTQERWLHWPALLYGGPPVFYLTVVTSRDVLTPLDFYEGNTYIDNWMPPGQMAGDSSYKKSQGQQPAQGDPISLFVYPNPFNSSTIVELHSTSGLNTEVGVYDVLGVQVETLFTGVAPTDGQLKLDLHGATLANSGTYFVRVTSGNQVLTKRIQLIK